MKKLELNWERYFNSTILKRGKDYYNAGYVKQMRVYDNRIEAKVNDYDTTIYYDPDDNEIMFMDCNCPYGGLCKHEAALLYAYENNFGDYNPIDDKNNPFVEDFKGKKQYYFNLYDLTKNLKFDKNKIEQAKQLISTNKIQLDNVDIGFVSGFQESQSLSAQAYFISNRKNMVRILLNNNEIRDFICGDYMCDGFGGYGYFYYEKRNNLCVHKIALLLLLSEYILKVNPGDYTNVEGSKLINSFNNSNFQTYEEEDIKEDIKLVPRLEYNDLGILKLSFKIGLNKMYNAKKYSELIDAYKNKTNYILSTKETIDFSKHDFDEESKKYFKIIKEALYDEMNRQSIRDKDYNVSRESKYFNINSSILLYGSRLDEVFDLLENQEVEINNKVLDYKGMIDVIKANPKISLSIKPFNRNNNFEGINLSGKIPSSIDGGTGNYYLDEHHLYKIDEAFSNVINSLNTTSYHSEIDISIGRKRLAHFYNYILPILEKNVDIVKEQEDELIEYIPVKPVFDYYFDVENGYINLDVKVTYGEDVYSLFDVDALNEKRDYYQESLIGGILSKYFNQYSDRKQLTEEADDDFVYNLLEILIPELLKTGNVHTTDAFDRLKVKRKIQTSVGVSIDNNLLELDISTDDMSLEELAQVIDSYRLKKKYHKLKSGELIRVDDKSVENLDVLLNSLNISLKDFVKGKINIPSYRALYLDKLLAENSGIYDQRDVYFKRLIKDFKSLKESEYEVVPSLNEIMRNYQKEGFRWLKTLSNFNFGGILADEMGLGKSLQSIALLLDYKQENEKISALIICPTSLIYNWLAEIDKFGPSLNAVAVVGSQKERKNIINNSDDYEVLITSYELLRRDIDLYQDKNFVFQILDEAQYIKTATTANAKTCKVIKAQKRFALTGTPIENNLSELWSIFDYLMPGFLFSHEKFKQKFETKIVKENDEKASEQLKQMIAPFILRRKKVDVLADLPDKIEETIKVKFDDVQQKLYDSQVLKISKTINDADEESFAKNKIAILAELTKIRQICCEPSLIYEDYEGESAKRQACIETIRNAIDEGHKILLFSQFTSMLEILQHQLDKEGIKYYKITGKTNKEDRLKLVDDFNENDVPVFMISLKAGGTGLNLTGADIVIHYDPWWNVAAQNQATDRTHRIGQDKVVTVYKIIAQDSIEEKIVDLQDKKAELAENILSGEAKGLASLSKEELMDLLSIK